jgi:hypothetical protein
MTVYAARLVTAGVLGMLAAACASAPVGPTDQPSPAIIAAPTQTTSHATASASSSPVSNEVASGPFRLTLTVPKATWSAAEVIGGEAVLTTDGAATVLCASGGGVIGYSYQEVGGDRFMEAVMQANEQPYPIDDANPIEIAVRKSGASYSASQPDADFYRSWFEDPQVHLPPGAWQITAEASFFEGAPDCPGPYIRMRAPVTIHVTP